MPGASRRVSTYPAMPTNMQPSEKAGRDTSGTSAGGFARFLAPPWHPAKPCIPAHHAGQKGESLNVC